MARFSLRVVALIFGTICGSSIVDAAGSATFELYKSEASRQLVDAVSGHRSKSAAASASSSLDHDKEKKNLYWFGNFTVGDGHGLQLLIDTGSSDLLLNPHEYQPSNNSKPYTGEKTFSITYEGVNKQGTGFETIEGHLYMDYVSDGTVNTPQQPIGSIDNYTISDAPPKKKAISGDGIIGFSSKEDSSFVPQSNSWVFNLCADKIIKQCRFALAFGTNKKGLTVIGDVDESLFDGDLTVTPLEDESIYTGWTTRGDVSFGKDLVFKNQTIIIDSGTSNMQAPLHIAKALFEKIGYGYTETVGGAVPGEPGENVTFLTGYYPCNKPPQLDISFPAQAVLEDPPAGAPISKHAKTFTLLEDQWPLAKNGHNNCTAILAGTNALANPQFNTNAWLVGQPFIEGRYVDFDIFNSIGFANLKHPHDPTGHLH